MLYINGRDFFKSLFLFVLLTPKVRPVTCAFLSPGYMKTTPCPLWKLH